MSPGRRERVPVGEGTGTNIWVVPWFKVQRSQRSDWVGSALESSSPLSTGLAQSFLQPKALKSWKENILFCTKRQIPGGGQGSRKSKPVQALTSTKDRGAAGRLLPGTLLSGGEEAAPVPHALNFSGSRGRASSLPFLESSVYCMCLDFCLLAFTSALSKKQPVDIVIKGPRATVASRNAGHLRKEGGRKEERSGREGSSENSGGREGL